MSGANGVKMGVKWFGVECNFNKGMKLSKENYASVCDSTNTGLSFLERVLNKNEYLKFPKNVILRYFQKVSENFNCETAGKKHSKRSLKNACEKKALLKMAIEVLKKTQDDDYLKVLGVGWSENLKISKSDYIKKNEYRLINYMSEFDFEKSCEGNIYSKKYCERLYDSAIKNFDLNMYFFSRLDKNEFENELCNFLKNNPQFERVYDLNECMFDAGYYIMVLDEFKQAYIGTTGAIGKRIVSHWSKKKHLDRLVFPTSAWQSSVLSIDAFCATDTTRIYCYKTSNTYSYENDFISQFDKKFLCNRVSGGRLDMIEKVEIKTKKLE